MKGMRCKEHQSPAERICTYSECADRRMCLLCDHGHVFLANLRQILWLDFGRFRGKVDSAIDEVLGQTVLPESRQEVQEQIAMTNEYFQRAIESIRKAVESKQEAILAELAAEEDDTVARLRSLRISGNYFQVPNDLFEIVMMLHEGGTLQQNYADKSARKLMNAQRLLNETANLIKDFLVSFVNDKKQGFPQPPDLTSAGSRISGRSEPTNRVSPSEGRSLSEAHQCNESRIQFESLISSAIEHNELYLTSCYDKKLRIISRDLDLLKEIEFNNTLEQVCSLSQKQLMVAVSRELHILNVTNDSHLDAKTLLKLRGHEGKILAIDKLNTRIVGSCSSQDLKIWDLYKEKEQYSLHKSEGLTDLKFIPGEKRLALGALDWSYKFYDVESMKMLKAYKLRGIPLTSSLIDINTMLVGGFPNVLTILDLRMPDPVYCEIGEEAITCLNIGQQIMLGNRRGDAIVFDIRRRSTVLSWRAHEGMTSWNRPNGVAAVLSNGRFVTTVGVNDRKLKKWNVV